MVAIYHFLSQKLAIALPVWELAVMQFHIGEQIAIYRKRAGWSQVDLSEKSGVNIQMVRKIEQREVDPRAGDLDRLADALGFSLVLTMNKH